jgi:nucleoside-diphosphate-sugar epimerase
MNILITGGAGYLGSVLVPELLKRSFTVTVVDNFQYRPNSLVDCCIDDNFQVVRGDCRDELLIKQLVASADLIIPLAAIVGAPACDADKIATQSINFDAIAMLCRLTGESQRIIYPTTNSGYGIGDRDQYCTEETPLAPISLYGITKVRAEEEVLQRKNAISLRLATVFGLSPRMRMDLLVNDFVYRAINDRTLTVFEGHFRRNFVHVRDVARAFIHGIDTFDSMKGGAYNVGLDDANLTKLELCEKIKEYVPSFVFSEAPIGEDPDKRDYIVSNEKIKKKGFVAVHSLDVGIQELIKGYTILRNTKFTNL